jgi:APA family basic amino acid/polyamine antiporter
MDGSIWAKKAADVKSSYQKVLGLVDLSSIGIAAIIGAGIFVFLGQEAIGTGPAVIISLLLAAVAALLAALSYAEASAILPGNGSGYAFAFATMGSLPAFLVGWLFINAYIVGNSGVATGWATFFISGFAAMGVTIPTALQTTPFHGGIMNLPSLLFIVAITIFALGGMKESKVVNNVLVAIKLAIVLFFIVVGVFLIQADNWVPFAPSGIKGVAGSTAILFFAYLGFDTIAATGAEAREPKKHLPIAIIISITIPTILYVLMALVVTGIAPSGGLDSTAPAADAFNQAGAPWAAAIITVGALVALATVAYAFHIACARIMQAMADDGFLPASLSSVSARGVPRPATIVVGVLSALGAAFVPLDLLIEVAVEASILVYIGVSVGILVNRRVNGKPEGFTAPIGLHIAAIVALLGVIVFGIQGYLIHVSTFVWILLGLVAYGFWAHSASLRVAAATPSK